MICKYCNTILLKKEVIYIVFDLLKSEKIYKSIFICPFCYSPTNIRKMKDKIKITEIFISD